MKPISISVNSSTGSRGRRVKNYEGRVLCSGRHTSLKFKSKSKSKFKKVLAVVGKVILVFVALIVIATPFAYYYLYLPAMELKDSAMALVDVAKIAKDHVDQQDLVAVATDLDIVEAALTDTEAKYEYFAFAKKIPYIKGYYENGEHVFAAAQNLSPVVENLIIAAIPVADVFGYKTSTGEHEEMGGQDKIETIVRNMPDISSVIAEMRPQIDIVLDELNQIDPKYIPEEIKGYRLNDMFDEASKVLSDGQKTMTDVESLLAVIPEVAGTTSEKTYLILFQNDKEIRPTGGFLTAFGYASVENGRLGNIESEDIYNLDKKIYSYDTAPEEIREYLGQYEWHLRDSNLYADLVSSSQRFESVYKNQYNPRPFDGIIYIDTQFVEALLTVTGPIDMPNYGTTISSDNVVYELELYSEKVFIGGEDRKQFMEDLMEELMDRLLESGSDQWSDLITATWGALESKHLMFYFHNIPLQELASEYGFTGEMNTDWRGDYLHINESNMGGLKSNMYVTSTVDQNVSIDSNGNITKTVKIHWENTEPKDHWLNGSYRCWLRIYVPYGSELLTDTVDVRQMNTEWDELDYGKTVFDTFVTVPTAESEDSGPGVLDLEFSYKLPKDVVEDDVYQLLIQKQPGKPDENYSVTINGQLQSYDLNRDTEIEFQL